MLIKNKLASIGINQFHKPRAYRLRINIDPGKGGLDGLSTLSAIFPEPIMKLMVGNVFLLTKRDLRFTARFPNLNKRKH